MTASCLVGRPEHANRSAQAGPFTDGSTHRLKWSFVARVVPCAGPATALGQRFRLRRSVWTATSTAPSLTRVPTTPSPGIGATAPCCCCLGLASSTTGTGNDPKARGSPTTVSHRPGSAPARSAGAPLESEPYRRLPHGWCLEARWGTDRFAESGASPDPDQRHVPGCSGDPRLARAVSRGNPRCGWPSRGPRPSRTGAGQAAGRSTGTPETPDEISR